MNTVVAALYKFTELPDYQALREPLLSLCQQQKIKGTLLLAQEGINGTIAGSRSGIDAVLDWLRAIPGCADLSHKESYTDKPPFLRMKVKLKKEIVTLGVKNIKPAEQTGIHVPPEEWNNLIRESDVLLLDTRNDYETAIGSFVGAVDPKTTNFREFPEYVQQQLNPAKHKRIAMFCTGGIRCEKASAYLLQQGFAEVYQLEGGILNYLEKIPANNSLWQGECFVFDERVAVNHQLTEGEYDQCYACRHPISAADKNDPGYEPGVSCPHCTGKRTTEQHARASERHKQMQLAKQRQQQHLGVNQQAISCTGSRY